MLPTTSTAPPGQTRRADRGGESASGAGGSDGALAEERLYTHQLTVLSVSSGMVGVCLTAIGLIGIMKSLTKVEMLVDDMLGVGAVMFMVTSLLSYVAMRTRFGRNWRSLTTAIDCIFCLALLLVAVATALLTWEVL